MSIRDLLTGGEVSLTPAEERIAQVLLNDYPTSGLGTASSLAKRASVSDPTVIRLVVKLGFDGFPAFQASLLGEVEDRLRSPLSMMAGGGGVLGEASGYIASARDAVDEAARLTPQRSYEKAARLINEARSVLAVGGRFSGFLAGMLVQHLEQFRPGVRWLPDLSLSSYDQLVDLGRRDVILAFDYRRYQTDVMSFVSRAADGGTRVVLFTDRWQSPLAARADVSLVAPVEVASPYDTMAPAVAQLEALIAQILSTEDRGRRARIERIEAIRAATRVTASN